jgi:hypothetical protein
MGTNAPKTDVSSEGTRPASSPSPAPPTARKLPKMFTISLTTNLTENDSGKAV